MPMKVFPVGFVEYKYDEDGNREVLGPHTESEEADECEKWNVSVMYIV